jgi:hypothetical protein
VEVTATLAVIPLFGSITVTFVWPRLTPWIVAVNGLFGSNVTAAIPGSSDSQVSGY